MSRSIPTAISAEKQAFPNDLPAQCCSRSEIEEFAKECRDLGVEYVGLCCGSCSHYLRVVAEVGAVGIQRWMDGELIGEV